MQNRYSLIRFKQDNPKTELKGKLLNEVIDLFMNTHQELNKDDLLTFMFGKDNNKGKFPFPITEPEVVLIYDNFANKVVSAIVTVNHRGVRYISHISTNIEYRKRDFAKILIEDAKRNMHGNTELRLHNREAHISLYRKLGFKVDPTGTQYSQGRKTPAYRAIWNKPK